MAGIDNEGHIALSDFSDALIAAINQRIGCDRTVTFDRKAGRRSMMALL